MEVNDISKIPPPSNDYKTNDESSDEEFSQNLLPGTAFGPFKGGAHKLDFQRAQYKRTSQELDKIKNKGGSSGHIRDIETYKKAMITEIIQDRSKMPSWGRKVFLSLHIVFSSLFALAFLPFTLIGVGFTAKAWSVAKDARLKGKEMDEATEQKQNKYLLAAYYVSPPLVGVITCIQKLQGKYYTGKNEGTGGNK